MTEWATIDDRRPLSDEMARLERALIQQFCPPLRPEVVERCLLEGIARFEHAAVQTFVLILVERAATERLHVAASRLDATTRSAEPAGIDAARTSRSARPAR